MEVVAQVLKARKITLKKTKNSRSDFFAHFSCLDVFNAL